MLTYKDSGVDVFEARELVGDIAAIRQRTEAKHRLMQSFGQFSACMELSDYKNPVIATTCDGVGTKIKPLLMYDMPETAGCDLVAMNVNDILTSNALPLMFLDYIGIGKLDRPLIKRLIAGIADALEACECILAGGETAEMPDLVEEGMVELSGFCVGAAEKDELIDPATISGGEILLGLPSNGFHATGWSLIRRIIGLHEGEFSEEVIRELLTPTRIYFPEVASLRESQIRPKGMAHITGGGIRENLERVLGENGAVIRLQPWENEAAQKVLAHITTEEAIHTFNMGVGWIIVADPEDVNPIVDALPEAFILGDVTTDNTGIEVNL